MHYGRNTLCRAAKSHGKGRKMLGKAFAVQFRTAKTTRQRSAWQRWLCRAHSQNHTAMLFAVRLQVVAVRASLPCAFKSLPCAFSLPCAVRLCRAPHFAVRHASLPCAPLCRAPAPLPCRGLCRAPSNLCRAPPLTPARQRAAFAVCICTAKATYRIEKKQLHTQQIQ